MRSESASFRVPEVSAPCDDLALAVAVEEDCDVAGAVRPGPGLRHQRPVRGDLLTERAGGFRGRLLICTGSC